MEPVVATGGNHRQIVRARERQKQAKTVAVGCDRLPLEVHGKEGVDGSSPSEGSRDGKVPAKRGFLLSDTAPQSTSACRRNRSRALRPIRKCLQIGIFPGTTEHLREAEGLDEVAATGGIETRWKGMKSRFATTARRTPGTGFGEL
jgi:hypothetical protein